MDVEREMAVVKHSQVECARVKVIQKRLNMGLIDWATKWRQMTQKSYTYFIFEKEKGEKAGVVPNLEGA